MKFRAMKPFMGTGGVVYRRGAEIELADAAAKPLLARGLVEPLEKKRGPDEDKKPTTKTSASDDKKSGQDDKETK